MLPLPRMQQALHFWREEEKRKEERNEEREISVFLFFDLREEEGDDSNPGDSEESSRDCFELLIKLVLTPMHPRPHFIENAGAQLLCLRA